MPRTQAGHQVSWHAVWDKESRLPGHQRTHLRKRRIAMVFQSYAVFPHLTIFENIAFGLRMQRVADQDVKKRVGAAAELLQITDLLKRYPAQVSGGGV